MQNIISYDVLKLHLDEWVQQADETKEPIVIERKNRPKLFLLSEETYFRLSQPAPYKIPWDMIDQTRQLINDHLDGRELPPPEEIIRQTREERDEQLTGLH